MESLTAISMNGWECSYNKERMVLVDKKVSVILPSLNAAESIEKCLKSILNQTLKEIEILCIDAGSTDGTCELLEKHAEADTRIRVVHSDRRSYGYQVNLGIELSQGEYIGIVESDDYIKKDMYEILYRNAHESGADYVRANCYYTLSFGGEERRIYHGRNWIKDGYYGRLIHVEEEPEAMLYSDFINIWDGLYSREFLNRKKIRLHESPGASYQDAGFAILCAVECEKVLFLEDYFYSYCFDNDGSSVKDQEKYKCTLSEFTWIGEQLRQRGKTEEKYEVVYRTFLMDACCWNVHRLTREYRRRFLEEMPDGFVKDYKDDLFGEAYYWKDFLLKLCGGQIEPPPSLDESKLEVKKGLDCLREALLSDTPLVLMGCPVGCTKNWGNVAEMIAFLKPGTVWGIADNSVKRHGKMFCGKKVVSVPDAVDRYPNARFLLPRVLCDEQDERTRERIPVVREAFWKQLRTLGIPEEQIDDRIYGLRDFLFNIDVLVGRSHVDEED